MTHAELASLNAQPWWNASADGLVLVDAVGRIRATNRALEDLFGFESNQLRGAVVEELIPESSRADHVRRRAVYESRPVSRPMAVSQLLEGLKSDGSTFPINVSLSRISLDGCDYTLAAVRDLTALVETEAELAVANRRRAIAEDHERIASELHDTVIQRLFALGLGLQSLPEQIADAEVGERVSAAVDTVDDIIRDIRTSIYGLRSHSARTERLQQQVLAVVDEFRPSLGFDPEVTFNGDVDEVTDVAIVDHLIPVVREALSNVRRHADASSVSLRLSVKGGQVVLEIADDGRGLPPTMVRSGLANLANRAIALNGQFEVGAGQPKGTVLRWSVPLEVLPHS